MIPSDPCNLDRMNSGCSIIFVNKTNKKTRLGKYRM